ncbi:hypothetical protein TRSC58_07561 [Trypanosoma rangeli SC58]|uniref:Uncharacterized protein n=1 Tax=Trypanosoma rangeli SC58 TaxID=429131 RepID=A0A061ISX1_TRYRA|nr:hypothetical protein TRSC58_07561 [Trypanosoma rangeli SC58]
MDGFLCGKQTWCLSAALFFVFVFLLLHASLWNIDATKKLLWRSACRRGEKSKQVAGHTTAHACLRADVWER